MVTRCDTSKVKGLQVGPSAKNAHRWRGTATIVLALQRTKVVLFAQRILSVQRMDGPPCAWWPRYKNSFPVCLQGSPFTFQHSRATPRKHMRHDQEVRNGCWYASKRSSAMSCPNNNTSKKKHAKCKTVTRQNAYRHTMFAATPSPIHRNGFWWRSQHPNIASSRTPSCVDYLGRSTDLGWGVCLYKEIMGVWSLDPANEDVEHWRKTEVPKLEKEWIGASNLRHKILKYLST